jgi:Protein of unknown function (DUF551)
MSEWQPIETAPAHTGKETASLRVLVIGGIYSEATKIPADGEWWREQAKQGIGTGPTHWMPLPEAPRGKDND